jgi:hypothetical protein
VFSIIFIVIGALCIAIGVASFAIAREAARAHRDLGADTCSDGFAQAVTLAVRTFVARSGGRRPDGVAATKV